MKKINNPHDIYFKKTFSRKRNAVDFLNGILPEELKKNIDLSQIQYENTTYIDSNLKNTYSDVIYSVYFRKKEFKIAFLMEHKSFFPRVSGAAIIAIHS